MGSKRTRSQKTGERALGLIHKNIGYQPKAGQD
jgi:hypothetical protein